MATEQVNYNVYLHLVGSDNRPVVDVYLKGYTDKAPRLHVSLGHLIAGKDEVESVGEFLASSTARHLEAAGTSVNIIRLSKGGIVTTGYGHDEEEN